MTAIVPSGDNEPAAPLCDDWAHQRYDDMLHAELERLREQRLYLVAALREARPLLSDAEIAFRFDAPGSRGEARLLAAFAAVDAERRLSELEGNR